MSDVKTVSQRLVVEASYGFKADGKYEAIASYEGKTYRATSSSSASALTTVSRKLLKAFPQITHINANGRLMALRGAGR